MLAAGGLHNRRTHETHLRPFNIAKTEHYFILQKTRWNRLYGSVFRSPEQYTYIIEIKYSILSTDSSARGAEGR